MTGNEYKKLIGRYIVAAYGSRGLKVYDEVSLGTSIIGKQRRIDLFVIGPDQVGLAVECKYQDSSGTADEKIPYALNDMAAQRVAGVLVYAGAGFSEGVRHLLQGSEQAAYCLPDEQNLRPTARRGGPMNSGTWQLDHALAQTFRLWDIILGSKPAMVSDAATDQAPNLEGALAERKPASPNPRRPPAQTPPKVPVRANKPARVPDLSVEEPLLQLVQSVVQAASTANTNRALGKTPSPLAKPRSVRKPRVKKERR